MPSTLITPNADPLASYFATGNLFILTKLELSKILLFKSFK